MSRGFFILLTVLSLAACGLPQIQVSPNGTNASALQGHYSTSSSRYHPFDTYDSGGGR